MKLNIGINELEAGALFRRMSTKQLESFRDQKSKFGVCETAFSIASGGRRCNLIILRECEPSAEKKSFYKIRFTPVFAHVFTVLNKASADLNAATILCNGKQFTITRDGVKNTEYTLNGAGCDPKVVAEAETEMPNLIRKFPSHVITRLAIQELINLHKE